MGIGFGHQSWAGVNKMQPLKIPLALIRWKLSKGLQTNMEWESDLIFNLTRKSLVLI